MPKTNKLPPPFSGRPPKEVPLERAPLARVIAQIRFPLLLAVTDPASVAPFQDQIRSAYPVADNEVIQHLVMAPNSTQEPVKTTAESIWRFQDRENRWRASLSPHFLALETTRYTSRRDFLGRLTSLITALEKTLNPQISTRIGLRYIDRLEGDAVANIRDLIRREILGSYGLFAPAVRYILANAEFNTEEGATITARWGMLPGAGTIDPNVLEPIAAASWVLDLDMYDSGQGDFSPVALVPKLESFAERIYAVFRFMVTDKFLAHYGRH
jgi:uncharacterized protein (TIGR04255 family)